MSAPIVIDFGGGQATTNIVEVQVTDATIALQAQSGLSASIGSGITNLSVTPDGVSIATGPGAILSGTLALAIDWPSSETPAVTLLNLAPASASPPTLSWPTASGPETQILTQGNPLALSGIVSD